ncbi:MAG TPA: putative molybdenum carrier protein [Xanthobacteraceae bacterium]|jgi:hypothetical protein
MADETERIAWPLEIVTGGQTGVDRAALDVAIEHAIPCSGWCPHGGWAEDFTEPPGLLAKYPMLRETPLADPAQRTEWNVRDSDALLILVDGRGAKVSKGTDLAIRSAERYAKPYLLVSLADTGAVDKVAAWLQAKQPRKLGVGGPRESEVPGIYPAAKRFLVQVLAG